jgi:hypothetical protein
MKQQNTNTMKKPFCKVCYDTGKPAEIYNNHFVKDIPGPKGVVICPTLLSLECRYCKQKGHTVSKCPAVAEKRSHKKYVKKTNTVPEKNDKKPTAKRNTNRFDLLETDDETPDEPKETTPEVEIEDELKTLTRNPNSYASVLSRIRCPSTSPPILLEPCTPEGSPPPLYEPRTPEGPPPPLGIVKPLSPPISPPVQTEPLAPRRPITRTMNWAEMEDSDDEDF